MINKKWFDAFRTPHNPEAKSLYLPVRFDTEKASFVVDLSVSGSEEVEKIKQKKGCQSHE